MRGRRRVVRAGPGLQTRPPDDWKAIARNMITYPPRRRETPTYEATICRRCELRRGRPAPRRTAPLGKPSFHWPARPSSPPRPRRRTAPGSRPCSNGVAGCAGPSPAGPADSPASRPYRECPRRKFALRYRGSIAARKAWRTMRDTASRCSRLAWRKASVQGRRLGKCQSTRAPVSLG